MIVFKPFGIKRKMTMKGQMANDGVQTIWHNRRMTMKGQMANDGVLTIWHLKENDHERSDGQWWCLYHLA